MADKRTSWLPNVAPGSSIIYIHITRILTKIMAGARNCQCCRIGWWEDLQETAIFDLMVKTMVSCRFSLKLNHSIGCVRTPRLQKRGGEPESTWGPSSIPGVLSLLFFSFACWNKHTIYANIYDVCIYIYIHIYIYTYTYIYICMYVCMIYCILCGTLCAHIYIYVCIHVLLLYHMARI